MLLLPLAVANAQNKALNDDETFQTSQILLLLTTAVLPLLLWKIFQWHQKRIAYIQAIDELPGPRLTSKSTWLGHIDLFKPSVNTVPNYPGLPRGFEVQKGVLNGHKQDGLYRLWLFHPFRAPFARAAVFVYDPILANQLLTDKSITKKLVKEPRIYGISKPLVGDSFLALPDTPRWKHQRKLAAKGFRQGFLEGVHDFAIQLLYDKVFPLLDADGKNRETQELCTRIAVEVLRQAAFGYSFCSFDKENQDESMYDIFQVLLTIITKRTRRVPFVSLLYYRENKEFDRCSKKLDGVIHSIVQQRLADYNENRSVVTDKNRKDLLSYMIQDDDTDTKLTEQELFGNARMYLFAGHDTTANTLALALYELATHPNIQEHCQTEVDAIFRTKNGTPTYSGIMAMEYLDATIKETLRYHSPAGVARRNEEEIKLTKNGKVYAIPQGTFIALFPWQTGHCVDNDPDKFDPQRFLSKNESDTNQHYIPFSIGPRNCVGMPLALTELKVILAYMIHRYSVRKTEGSEGPIKLVLLTVKAHEVRLDFTRREH